jgi:hypothetical protein
MIEKKISYEINIEKPSKTKPVKQGGVLNYLGKQKTVNAPVKWRSSPKHPVAHLSYITKDEEKILIDLNLYGSLKGKPNKGPFGLPSLQGSGGGAGGGDGGGGGGGGGDSASGQSGAQSSGNTDGNNDGETSGGPGAGIGGPGGFGGGFGGGPGGSEGFSTDTGPGPGEAEGMGTTSMGQADTFASDVEDTSVVADVDMSMPALQTMQEKAMANLNNTLSPAGIFGGILGAMTGIPGGFTIGSSIASSMARGVTGPDDFSQAQTSVQTGPTQSPGGDGGITTLPTYAPLYNQTTGDPLLDSLIARYRANMSPSSYGV